MNIFKWGPTYPEDVLAYARYCIQTLRYWKNQLPVLQGDELREAEETIQTLKVRLHYLDCERPGLLRKVK